MQRAAVQPVVMIRPIWEHRHTLPHEVANYRPVVTWLCGPVASARVSISVFGVRAQCGQFQKIGWESKPNRKFIHPQKKTEATSTQWFSRFQITGQVTKKYFLMVSMHKQQLNLNYHLFFE